MIAPLLTALPREAFEIGAAAPALQSDVWWRVSDAQRDYHSRISLCGSAHWDAMAKDCENRPNLLAPTSARLPLASIEDTLDRADLMRIYTHMRKNTHEFEGLDFYRGERQTTDVLQNGGGNTARDIWQRLPPPYSTARPLLTVLDEKAFVYRPRQQRETAAVGALRQLISTFFRGSVEQTTLRCGVARIATMINKARKETK